jgi:hypothetical protein
MLLHEIVSNKSPIFPNISSMCAFSNINGGLSAIMSPVALTNNPSPKRA